MKIDWNEIIFCISLGLIIGPLLGLISGNDLILFTAVGLVSGLLTALCALSIQRMWQKK